MEKICRFSLAFFLLVAAGDIFFRFWDYPEPPLSAQEFLISLTAAEYIWPSAGAIMLICSALLCCKKLVGMALVILFPLALNVVLYTIFLDNSLGTILPKVILILLYLVVGILNRQVFKSLIGR
jgi:putative oxidoreductase